MKILFWVKKECTLYTTIEVDDLDVIGDGLFKVPSTKGLVEGISYASISDMWQE